MTASEDALKPLEDGARNHPREDQDHEPPHPGKPQGHGARLAVDEVGHVHGAELVDVLRGLGLQHVQDVVHGDDPHQAALLVHHRQHGEVVVGHEAGHLLLVRVRAHVDHLGVHDLRHPRPGVGHDEVPQGEHPLEAALFVHHVDVVDGLGVGGRPAQEAEDLLHGHPLPHGHVLRGHEAARLVLLVPGQGLHLGPRPRVQEVLEALEVGGVLLPHRLKGVGEVVQGELLQDLPQAPGGRVFRYSACSSGERWERTSAALALGRRVRTT